MFDKIRNSIGFERDSSFVAKVLFLCLPSLAVFSILSLYNQIEPLPAVLSLACIAAFNIIVLLPLTLELQKVRRYMKKLSRGENADAAAIKLSEHETRELIDAINNMHRFWADKTDTLQAQRISDTAVLDSLPDPLLVNDNDGVIMGANLSARSTFGDKIMFKSVDEIFHSHNFIKAVSRVLNGESESENLVFYIDKPFSCKLYAHIKQLPWQAKSHAQAVISIYDLTKSLKVEKMQSDFVANASHELKTPLSVISGFVETLRTTAKNDDEAREQFLGIIADQTEYMSTLIEKLLSLSRIELLQDEEPQDKVNLRKIAADIKKTFAIRAGERDMELNIIADARLAPVKGDEQQIKQVLQNLVENAIKYGEEHTPITIRINNTESIPPSRTIKTAQGAAVSISINNKGPKIQPEDLARLTERFYRLQEHKDRKIKGTGLGLAITKHIIIRHRGNITVNSNGYNGTTFTIYLPAFTKSESSPAS